MPAPEPTKAEQTLSLLRKLRAAGPKPPTPTPRPKSKGEEEDNNDEALQPAAVNQGGY